MENSLKLLRDNPLDVFEKAAQLLIQCLEKILQEPNNPRYRRLRIASEKVQNYLLPVSGAIECLFSVGFEGDDEYFTLPQSASLDNLKKMHGLLSEKHQVAASVSSVSVPAQSSGGSQQRHESAVVRPESESAFYGRLLGYMEQMKNYTQPAAQERARNTMPLKQLKQAAEENLRHLGPSGGSFEDQLLIELLGWFKESFFRWMDAPSCSACTGPTDSCGMVRPDFEETAHQAQRVENYQCRSSTCRSLTRFPRYNDPVRLLETRVGRCGEWANCFTLCCIAAGLDARFVVDWTDHVWTEVYSASHKRWIHADPCENVCDKPLMYEAGWGKKLSYVIAFSPDDMQDVTWRYTAKPQEVLARRTLCREGWLVSVIVALRKRILDQRVMEGNLSAQRRALLELRTVDELIEFMSPRDVDTKGLGGRTTGSLEWRRARGELGNAAFEPNIIRPTAEELSCKLLEVRYSSAKNEYVRGTSVVIKDWKNMVFEFNSVFRKVESDWKMAYLARVEGSQTGSVTWKFDLGSQRMCIDELEVKVHHTCFENGQVRWTLCGNDQCVMLNAGDELKLVDAMSGCTEFKLTAALQGGKGDTAWQHSQLFRQSLNDVITYPFHVRVKLRNNVATGL